MVKYGVKDIIVKLPSTKSQFCWQNPMIHQQSNVPFDGCLNSQIDSSFCLGESPQRRKIEFFVLVFNHSEKAEKCHKRQLLLTSSFGGKNGFIDKYSLLELILDFLLPTLCNFQAQGKQTIA